MAIDWWKYERRKNQLPDNLTCEEYEKEIKRITEELEDGIYDEPIEYI